MGKQTRHVIGCMTGTSLDGLDAVLTRIDGSGTAMTATYVGMVSRPLGELAEVLRSLTSGKAQPPIDYMRAARRLGELHAEAVADLLTSHDAELDFVVAHGQTIWHAPRDEAGGLSWQLFDPWPLVRRLGLPVCYDLRQADLIAGGQGAPLTPLSDWVMYRDPAMDPAQTTLVANLGGICNLTRLLNGHAPDFMDGWDAFPCNLLIDGVVRSLLGDRDYDRNGEIAATGRFTDQLHRPVSQTICSMTASAEPVSMGREQFSPSWCEQLLRDHAADLSPEDAIASAVEVVARCFASEQSDYRDDRLVLAGGGARNPVLVDRIRKHVAPFGAEVLLSDDLGIPCEAREGMAFAVLGALAQDGVPITLPQVTGSTRPGRAGAWVYP